MLDGILGSPDCSELCKTAGELLGCDFETWWSGLDDAAIFANENAQFAIALYQLAVWQRIRLVIPEPVLIAGYSLGELLAYHVAGSMDARETLRLVQKRSLAMNEASSGISTASGCMLLCRGRMSDGTWRSIAENELDTAIMRGQGDRVLAGPADAIDNFLREIGRDNPNIFRLPISSPSHSHYLSSAAAAFRSILQESSLEAPLVPVLAGTDGMRIRSRMEAVGALSRQIDTTIRWDLCMDALKEAGISALIELGPGNDLAKLIEIEHPEISARSINDFRDWRSVSEWLRERDICIC